MNATYKLESTDKDTGMQGWNQDLNSGGQSLNQKNFKWHGLLKKKIMVGKTIAFYYHKYLSQEGNNMN